MADRDSGGLVMMCVIFTLFMAAGVVYFMYQQGAVTPPRNVAPP